MTWELDGNTFESHLLLGTARYPSLTTMSDAITASDTEIITVSLRRESSNGQFGEAFWNHIKQHDVHILPNTAGCMSAKEAITTALMAREVFDTHWIKLEVIGNDHTLQPNPFELVSAAEELSRQGFAVFPYTTDDLIVCEKLMEVGCHVLMPWGAPIGSGKGLMNPYALRTLRSHFPNVPLIVDAGIGAPSHACQAMELGFDGILLNTAVAQANDPVAMAAAFKHAIEAGRTGYQAGILPEQDFAQASTPELGKPFWHE
ncbi:thiazole synthase [Marinibactrum halimedae]|uniref:Thiazole synthase n=1 Tax=Marinibactrum halimedae TaxID=1444977 RepID=A0AA37T8K7_9GAMM|nr:thiazole synthase [Marinibactrum halimedae]MCD9458688.1 thiazole synthase [Marinibactrum halimedae]GLS25946.1 thiazole synthase [Marinibactrum halimedae]